VSLSFIYPDMPGRLELHASDWVAGMGRPREDGRVTPVPRVVFLPGAGGDGEFWRGVGEALPGAWEKVYLSWPGLGDQAHDLSVRGFEDLVGMVLDGLDRPSDLVAQSMGGVVAVEVATRAPQLVRRLVLVATSGGVDVGRLGADDWRAEYRRAFPEAAGWVADPCADQTDALRRIASPTLLLWGGADPISPVAVGEHLAALIPDAALRVVGGATHEFGRDEANTVAPLIEAHLR